MDQLVEVEDTARGAELFELRSKKGGQLAAARLAVRMKQAFLKGVKVFL
jgi:hypothetical protein